MNSLDRKMDRILAQENSGRIKKGIKNRALRKMFANKLSVVGIVIFVVILFMCCAAPLFTSYSSTKVDLKNMLQPPSAEHILGTDKIGRDIWARILYGGRVSIGVGLGSALIATILGVSLGTIAGYKGGLFDGIVMKISEILMAFPQMILVLILVTITGQSLWNLIFIFSITGWPSMYRMARSQMLSLREQEYVQALKAFGIGSMRIAFVHMLPNAIGPIFVNITLSTAMFILQEASLSFLGLGVPLEVATWGNILNAAQDLTILKGAWWIWLPTGIVVTLFVISINFIGDGLRDATDPSQIG
ncbi:ABC transporter permease [Marvinbryantia sp.]|uniref:ABC transporter permease n=1 Tax=Marvinbryantia sp. TaxID=2496532 RepID=UPI0025F1BD15|nr:ABC transporter permease [uncultured Marvinbryantia sp.]